MDSVKLTEVESETVKEGSSSMSLLKPVILRRKPKKDEVNYMNHINKKIM